MSGGTFPCYVCGLYTWIEQEFCAHCGESTLPPEHPRTTDAPYVLITIVVTEQELRDRAKNNDGGKN